MAGAQAEHSGSAGDVRVTGVLRTVRQVLGAEVRAERGMLLLALLCTLAGGVLLLLGPYSAGLIIDRALPTRDLGLFGRYAGLMLAAYAGSYVFWVLQVYFALRASGSIFRRLRDRLFASILRKRTPFFGAFSRGDIMTRAVDDVNYASSFFYENLLLGAAFALHSLILLVFMLVWHWQLGLVSALLLPVMYVYSRRVQGPVAVRSQAARERLSAQNELLLDVLSGHEEVRFFQQQRQWFERLRQANAAYTRANVRASVFAQWSWGGVNAIGLLITLVPFLIGGYLICRGNPAISVGVLVAYYSYLTNLANKVQFVFGGLTYLAQGHPSLVRIRELLDYPEEAEPRRQGIESAPGHTAIEFRDLCYTHPLGGRVLEGFSLRIEPGEKVAITGPSGAGKSTLVRLLLRFLLPSSGELLFGDRPVQDYDLGFYCTFFGYVSQSTHLFGLPIGENIAMGWYGVPEERIREVAGLVRLDPVIRRLPEGYDTVIGSGGTRLSGGQEQRLALARALVREPEVLVLDEFTSGLDREVEDAILDDLFRVFADQSILCITHSESVAARFDRVVRLDPVGGTAPGPAAAPDPAAHGGR